ncbi:MAG: polysaccharide biosynthesis C-terminal domain-containing protein, partial [Thermoprotei archaeon]
RIATILIVPVSVIVALMAKPIVTVLYGSAYLKYFILLSIFAVGYLSVGLGGQTQAPLFMGLNNTRLNAYSAAISAALLLSASFGLVLRFSVFGVALATTISTVVTVAVMHILVTKSFGVRLPRTSVAKVYLASVVSVVPLIYILQKNFHHGLIGLVELALTLGAYIVIYSTVLPLMKGVSKEDLDLISHALKDVPRVGHILAAITKYSKLLVHERG